jgi:hypothetical protein
MLAATSPAGGEVMAALTDAGCVPSDDWEADWSTTGKAGLEAILCISTRSEGRKYCCQRECTALTNLYHLNAAAAFGSASSVRYLLSGSAPASVTNFNARKQGTKVVSAYGPLAGVEVEVSAYGHALHSQRAGGADAVRALFEGGANAPPAISWEDFHLGIARGSKSGVLVVLELAPEMVEEYDKVVESKDSHQHRLGQAGHEFFCYFACYAAQRGWADLFEEGSGLWPSGYCGGAPGPDAAFQVNKSSWWPAHILAYTLGHGPTVAAILARRPALTLADPSVTADGTKYTEEWTEVTGQEGPPGADGGGGGGGGGGEEEDEEEADLALFRTDWPGLAYGFSANVVNAESSCANVLQNGREPSWMDPEARLASKKKSVEAFADSCETAREGGVCRLFGGVPSWQASSTRKQPWGSSQSNGFLHWAGSDAVAAELMAHYKSHVAEKYPPAYPGEMPPDLNLAEMCKGQLCVMAARGMEKTFDAIASQPPVGWAEHYLVFESGENGEQRSAEVLATAVGYGHAALAKKVFDATSAGADDCVCLKGDGTSEDAKALSFVASASKHKEMVEAGLPMPALGDYGEERMDLRAKDAEDGQFGPQPIPSQPYFYPRLFEEQDAQKKQDEQDAADKLSKESEARNHSLYVSVGKMFEERRVSLIADCMCAYDLGDYETTEKADAKLQEYDDMVQSDLIEPFEMSVETDEEYQIIELIRGDFIDVWDPSAWGPLEESNNLKLAAAVAIFRQRVPIKGEDDVKESTGKVHSKHWPSPSN